MKSEKCPCGSGADYSECCSRFHQGGVPENALQLMRSRYSAYAMNLPDYIIKTTSPASPHFSDNLYLWNRNIVEFCQNTEFQKLEVIDFKENENLATVTFTAYISQAGKDAPFTERSYFEKRKGFWLYLRGRNEMGYVPEMAKGPEQHFPLAYYGDPILTTPALEIEDITEEIKLLATKMIESMHSFPGLGLAAPQIKQSVRLFVAQPPVENLEGKFEPGKIEVYINPKITSPSVDTWIEEEGCLSIPTIRGKVKRPKQATIEYINLEGNPIIKVVSGWEARVIMHEYDHLEGILFTDRLEKKERYQFEPRLRQLKQRIEFF